MLERKDIDQLCMLSRMEITAEEKDAFLVDLGPILGYVSDIGTVVTEEASPTLGALANVMREDVAHEGGSYTDSILANAPRTEDGFIKVPKILG